MNINLRTILKITGVLAILAVAIFFIYRYNTKAHSPEDTVIFEKDDLKLEVFYNRPYKKDRKIFGELVPYNEVWRTGANEATTFTTNKNIRVDGSLLRAGKYTLWTIPMENSWKIIFNDKMYPWGINLDKVPYRNPEYDDLIMERPVLKLSKSIEQFTISFIEENDLIFLVLAWDKTSVTVPIKVEEAPEGTSLQN